MLVIFHVYHDVILLPDVGEVEHVMCRCFAFDISRGAKDDVDSQSTVSSVNHRLRHHVQVTAAGRAPLLIVNHGTYANEFAF